MSPSRRPRRSASGKAAQYNAAKIFAQLLDSSSSGTEEAAPDLHSDTPQQPEAGAGPSTTTAVRNSPQKRIEVSSSGSSESGSNFDPEEGKDQQRAPGQSQQSGPSTDDSEDDVQDEEEEEEEDELGQNPEPDSDEDSVVDMSIRKIKPLPKLKGSQLTQNRAKVPKASTSKIPAVAAAATYGAKLRKKPKAGGDLFWASVPPQAMHGARAMMNHRYLAYEEAWGYDALESDMLHLTKSAAHPSHTRSSHPEPAECLQDVGLNHTTALDSSARQRLNHAWRCTPFGPTYGLCQDSKWSKGKRTTPKSWGGWYNKMQLRHQTQKLSFEDAERYLPWGDVKESKEEEENQSTDGIMQGPDGETELPTSTRLKGSVACWMGPGIPDDASSQGAPEVTKQQLFDMERFSALRLSALTPGKPGHVLNAGGPVWSLDWCPLADVLHPAEKEYLAVATTTDEPAVGAFAPTTSHSHTTPTPLRGFVQLWSLDVSRPQEMERYIEEEQDYPNPPVMQFEGGLCVDVGEAWFIKWCPRGGWIDQADCTSLGLLAGVFTDGRIHIFDIPKPNGAAVSYMKANPLLSLHIPGTNITCLDWCSHERIVAGCENGYMAVWDVKDALLSSEPVQHLRPVHYLSNQEGAIRKICVVQIPPPGPDLKLNDLAEPTMIATTGFDGSHQLVDLRDPRTASALLHFRDLGSVVTYDHYRNNLVANDVDDLMVSIRLRPQFFGNTMWCGKHLGSLWDAQVSPFSPFLATVSSDGTCRINNMVRRGFKKQAGQYTQIVFKMDFNRNTKQYRMVDNLAPEPRAQPKSEGSAIPKRPKSKAARGKTTTEEPQSHGAWPMEVATQCVSWGKSIHRPLMLATGTNSGLVRVDWVEGPLGEDFGVEPVLETPAEDGVKMEDDEPE